MVLKSLIRYFLNRYLKNYIQTLDDEKFDFDLRNGFVQLENLQLKPEALANLNLPILVAAGHLEKLTMSIPWMNLSRRPSEIHLKGLFILIVPKNEMERDTREERANKMRKVQKKVEEMKRIILENVQLDEKDQSLFERISKQILQNLRIRVEDFHFAYQTESTSKLGHPFAFGLTFQSVELVGEKFDPSRSKAKTKSKGLKETSIVYSFREIRCLSIYWNRIFQSKNEQTVDEIIKRLKKQTGRTNDRSMNFIHQPADVEMDFQLFYHRPEEKFHRSSFDVSMSFGRLSLHLNSKQFSDLLDFFKFQNYSTLYERCRAYRDLYWKEVRQSDLLTAEERQRIEMLETKLDTFNLAYIRFSVQTEIDEANLHSAASPSVPSSPIPSSSSSSKWNFWKKKKHRSFDEYHTIAMQISQMYSDDAMKLYFEDLPNVNVKLNGQQLHLYLVQPTSAGEADELITYVHVQQMFVDVCKRSISSNTLLKMSIVRVDLFGYETKAKKVHLVGPEDEPNESNPSIDVQFELFPSDSTRSDYRFHWQNQPIRVIYSHTMFNRIVQNFETNVIKESEFYTFTIEDHSKEQRQVDVLHQKVFDLRLHFNRVQLVFPHPSNGSSVSMSLQNIHLRTIFPGDHRCRSAEPNDELYQKYLLTCHHLRLKHAFANGPSTEMFEGKNSLSILFHKCLYMNDRDLTDWLMRVDWESSGGALHLSDATLAGLRAHFLSIPRLQSTLEDIVRRVNFFFVIFHPLTSVKLVYSISVPSLLFTHSNELFRIRLDLRGEVEKSRAHLQQIHVDVKALSISRRSTELVADRSSRWRYLHH